MVDIKHNQEKKFHKFFVPRILSPKLGMLFEAQKKEF
jgi:hypothetical protein